MSRNAYRGREAGRCAVLHKPCRIGLTGNVHTQYSYHMCTRTSSCQRLYVITHTLNDACTYVCMWDIQYICRCNVLTHRNVGKQCGNSISYSSSLVKCQYVLNLSSTQSSFKGPLLQSSSPYQPIGCQVKCYSGHKDALSNQILRQGNHACMISVRVKGDDQTSAQSIKVKGSIVQLFTTVWHPYCHGRCLSVWHIPQWAVVRLDQGCMEFLQHHTTRVSCVHPKLPLIHTWGLNVASLGSVLCLETDRPPPQQFHRSNNAIHYVLYTLRSCVQVSTDIHTYTIHTIIHMYIRTCIRMY